MSKINKELIDEKNERKRKKLVRVDSKDVYKVIKKFDKEWGKSPRATFLAGFFNVTVQSIYAKLNILEEEKKIKRIKKHKHFVDYELIS